MDGIGYGNVFQWGYIYCHRNYQTERKQREYGSYTFTDGNLEGYTLDYDIKGNGSNIKKFKLNKN